MSFDVANCNIGQFDKFFVNCLMQIPAGAECFVWEFVSSSMSILVDPLDVAFPVGVYISLWWELEP
jgi:hypothetical protein